MWLPILDGRLSSHPFVESCMKNGNALLDLILCDVVWLHLELTTRNLLRNLWGSLFSTPRNKGNNWISSDYLCTRIIDAKWLLVDLFSDPQPRVSSSTLEMKGVGDPMTSSKMIGL